MARWMWRPWVYVTGIPQIAWTVRQLRRLPRRPIPVRYLADMDDRTGWQWRAKSVLSAHSWMVVVIHGREVPAQPDRVNGRGDTGEGRTDAG